MSEIPRVVLFGSIAGNWREEHVIPVLEELGVSYYNPIQENGWTQQSGKIEVRYMAECETIVMVVNRSTPAFTALAESGWAALGCVLRGQTFILQIDRGYTFAADPSLAESEAGVSLERGLQHWATSSRYLVHRHALAFDHPRMFVVDTLQEVAQKLREIYTR